MLTIAVVTLATITSFCQPGFSVDERIDISKNILINYYNQHSNDPVKKYLTDYAGSNLTQSYLFRDIDLSTYELFVANFSFSDKDQVQKINFQPFKLLNSNNGFAKALGNFKINIVQKKDITTFGLGIGGDNSSPWSKKSKKLMAVHFNTIAAPPPPKTFDNSIYVKQHTAIENEVEQKKLTPETAIILHTIVDESEKQARTKAKQEYMKELEKFDEVVLDQALLNFDLARVKHVFKWTLGYNSQFFTILGAKGNVNNFDSLNFYSNKAGVIGATASYSYNNGWLSISGGYNSIDSRKNAAKTVNKVKYTGASFSLNKRVIKFLKDDKLKEHPAYLKSLFVPSINAGFSWELKRTNETNFSLIEEGVKRSRAFSPFIDILVTPATQFRISLPFQKTTLVDGSKQTFLGANVQYSLKFSNLN